MRIDAMKVDVMEVAGIEFKLPVNYRLVVMHLDGRQAMETGTVFDSRRITIDTRECRWQVTIIKTRDCENCCRDQDVAWFKGYGKKPEDAMKMAVENMERYHVLCITHDEVKHRDD